MLLNKTTSMEKWIYKIVGKKKLFLFSEFQENVDIY